MKKKRKPSKLDEIREAVEDAPSVHEVMGNPLLYAEFLATLKRTLV